MKTMMAVKKKSDKFQSHQNERECKVKRWMKKAWGMVMKKVTNLNKKKECLMTLWMIPTMIMTKTKSILRFKKINGRNLQIRLTKVMI